MSKVSINVTLKKRGEEVQSITSPSKTRVFNILRSEKNVEWDSGVVTVYYNRPKNFYSQAQFKNLTELADHLSANGMLDKYIINQFST